MFTHLNANAEPHQHATVADARDCEDALNVPEQYDEDGEIAMMRMLETDEIQRHETDMEEMASGYFSVYNEALLPNHREMTVREVRKYRNTTYLRTSPSRGIRLHHIDETCNCPNSYARCHIFENCLQGENV